MLYSMWYEVVVQRHIPVSVNHDTGGICRPLTHRKVDVLLDRNREYSENFMLYSTWSRYNKSLQYISKKF